ncbi:MAG: hypothetical protein JWQ25_2066 [Daejeonella sp.]|nr:hypothetical protein [Daejeonella sp.]
MKQIYIQTKSGQEGPFSIGELSQRNISPDTPVWCEGMDTWTAASKVLELQGKINFSNTPPPFINVPPSFDPKVDNFTAEKRSYKPSLYQLAGIGIVVVSAFLYFSKKGDASTSTEINSANVELIDSSAEVGSAEEERKRINERITARNVEIRNNWMKYIVCGNGDYKASGLGGIYDLEVIVANTTEYILDEVNVTVSYIKDNGDVYKTEDVTIYNVPVDGKASMPAPDSNRGTTVTMEIKSITSKKMHYHYSAQVDVEGKEDPYFAKY